MKTIKVKLLGLHCSACQKISEKRLGQLSGVEKVSVDVQTSIAQLQIISPITLDQINQALSGTGYLAESLID